MQTEETFELGRKFWADNFNSSSGFNLQEFIGKSNYTTNVKFENFNLEIKQDSYSKLIKQCNGADWLLYTYLLSVFNIICMKYTNLEHIVTGIPTTIESNESNVIPLFVALNQNDSFKDLLLKLQEKLSLTYRYSTLPLDVLIKELSDDKNGKSTSYFDTVILFNGIHQNKYLQNPSKPFGIFINKNEAEIGISFSYDSSKIDSWQVKMFAERFYNVLEQTLNNVNIKISEINLINKKELNLISDFNNTTAFFPDKKTIHQVFEEQVLKTPDNIALIFENKTLTYKELNCYANQFARKLTENGIGAGSIIPIILDRSIEMMIGILGILKSGAAYLPINSDQPRERIKYFLDDCQAKIIVTSEELVNHLELTIKMATIDMDKLGEYSSDNLYRRSHSTDLAYVIYTSGSTGNPKGVMVEHKSVINRLNWMQKMYPLTEEDVILQKTPFTFDVSVFEIFLWQISGAKLCLLPPNEEKKS